MAFPALTTYLYSLSLYLGFSFFDFFCILLYFVLSSGTPCKYGIVVLSILIFSEDFRPDLRVLRGSIVDSDCYCTRFSAGEVCLLTLLVISWMSEALRSRLGVEVTSADSWRGVEEEKEESWFLRYGEVGTPLKDNLLLLKTDGYESKT